MRIPNYREWSKKIFYPKIKELLPEIDDYFIVFDDDDYNINQTMNEKEKLNMKLNKIDRSDLFNVLFLLLIQ